MKWPICILSLLNLKVVSVRLSCSINDGSKSIMHIWLKRLTGGGGSVGKNHAKMQYLPNVKSSTMPIASSNMKSAIASWMTIECICHSIFMSRTSDAVREGNGLCMQHLNNGVNGVIINVRLILKYF
jgi:hypothetical protein